MPGNMVTTFFHGEENLRDRGSNPSIFRGWDSNSVITRGSQAETLRRIPS